MKVIREMLVKVETQQQTHLEQLSKMEEQTKYVQLTCCLIQSSLATYSIDQSLLATDENYALWWCNSTSGLVRSGYGF